MGTEELKKDFDPSQLHLVTCQEYCYYFHQNLCISLDSPGTHETPGTELSENTTKDNGEKKKRIFTGKILFYS